MMKTYLTILAFFTLGYSFSQMEDGNYTYANSEFTLSFTIGEDGWEIFNIVIMDNANGDFEEGTGEWFKVNMNGADEDYEGPEGWYQFQTDNCKFDFNEAIDDLYLNRFECNQDPDASSSYTLLRID
jgi:hypothetical protein